MGTAVRNIAPWLLFVLVEPALRCFETGRLQEAAEALGGDRALELRALGRMLRESRCLPFALYTSRQLHVSAGDAANGATTSLWLRAATPHHSS